MDLKKDLKVILVASEMAPFAKTGGLADVVGSLPKALSNPGNVDVWTVIPKYRFIDDARYGLKDIPDPVRFTISGMPYEVRVKYLEYAEGWKAYFIEHAGILSRDGMYGYHDDGYRFAFLAKAALETAKTLNFRPDVFHCHDWHAGFIPVYLKTVYRDDPFFRDTATVFTIHNLAYQGVFSKELLPYLEIGWEEFKAEKLEYWNNINFIKAGISYSDVVNTVSKKYSAEIQMPEYGESLDGVLRYRKNDLYGILNGLDYDVWNPATDKAIARNYDLSSLENKAENKVALQKDLGLSQNPQIPMAGVVSRLSYQKGLDIIVNAAYEMASSGIQLVVVGTGEEYYQNLFLKLAHELPNNVRTHLVFDDSMARRVYAGCDMFLMPSRYEPCGLSQLMSMRYGTIPVVRKTGGLADTVQEYDPYTGNGTGFSFEEASPNALMEAVRKALRVYHFDKDNWRKAILNAMNADFSWKNSAREYVELYKRAIQNH